MEARVRGRQFRHGFAHFLQNERADNLGLSYDSDARKILTGRNAGLTEAEILREAQQGNVEVG